MFLTETDTKSIQKEEDYAIDGYTTILPCFNKNNPKIRIIALVKNEDANNFKCRKDLMSDLFPSIWLEYTDRNKQHSLISGFCYKK